MIPSLNGITISKNVCTAHIITSERSSVFKKCKKISDGMIDEDIDVTNSWQQNGKLYSNK